MDFQSFIKILKANGIEVVVDVRRWPTSKIEDFKRESLERLLRYEGIEYLWMGDSLGGYRKGGYAEYMKTDEFNKGLERLVGLAMERTACIMCMEAKPSSCHRRFISERLLELRFEVLHILPSGGIIRAGLERTD